MCGSPATPLIPRASHARRDGAACDGGDRGPAEGCGVRPWLGEVLAGSLAQHAALVRPYATWHVLRRARRQARGTFTMSAAGRARGRILAALARLDDCGTGQPARRPHPDRRQLGKPHPPRLDHLHHRTGKGRHRRTREYRTIRISALRQYYRPYCSRCTTRLSAVSRRLSDGWKAG